MPAAIAIGMVVSSVVSAKIASNAAKKAAATQSAGTDRALQAQQENFNRVAQVGQQQSAQAQAQFDPYNQLSQSAMSALYQRLGMAPPQPMGRPMGGPMPGQMGQGMGGYSQPAPPMGGQAMQDVTGFAGAYGQQPPMGGGQMPQGQPWQAAPWQGYMPGARPVPFGAQGQGLGAYQAPRTQ